MSQCRSCGAEVLWVKVVPMGRLMPVDAEPKEAGNMRMLGERNAVAKVLNKVDLQDARNASEKLYASHFATCPNAKQHRSKP